MKMHHINIFPAFLAVIIDGMGVIALLGPAAASLLGMNQSGLMVSLLLLRVMRALPLCVLPFFIRGLCFVYPRLE
jgi:hypothetical protein